jgi:cephalosporin hydroxylase
MKITIENNESQKNVELYSEEGIELVSQLWIKLCTEYRHTHECTWMGMPIIQLTNDIIMMQELIWRIKPDVIVECGVAHGGSTVFYASLFELMKTNGRVIGVDVEIREHNRIAIENHAMSDRITLIEGSSTDSNIVEQVTKLIEPQQTVLVILDSNHTTDHVLKELQVYSPIVSENSYIIAMDGAQAWVADIPSAQPHWKDSHPLRAVELFLMENDSFIIDPQYTRLKVTANPNGFLQRTKSIG